MDLLVEAHIEKAKELIATNTCDNMFNMIYPFSNENLAGCLKEFHLSNKDCLTVLGSSDQALDMSLFNAKSITAFDINPLTPYYFYLKKAALMANLSYQQYLEFFCYLDYPDYWKTNDNAFNKQTFDKLVPYLKDDNLKFWSSLFDTFTSLEIRKSNQLFSFDESSYQTLKQTINYLNETHYDELKEKASSLDINFLNFDIYRLEKELSQKYDFMYLSNIIQYTDKIIDHNFYTLTEEESQTKQLNHYRQMIENLGKNLNEDGKIMAGYIYAIKMSHHKKAIFNGPVRDKVFKDDSFSYIYFPAISTIDFMTKHRFNPDIEQDACLIYKKDKN